jgi:GTPase Era involved in 16S rRNA processing/uncharacterized tellurite resistance protein B-like protein
MNIQLISSQAVKLLSKLTGQDLTVHDITPQVLFTADLLALLKGVIYADGKVSEDEVSQFKETLSKLNLISKKTSEVSKILFSGIQKYKLHAGLDEFLVLLVPLSEAEKLLLFGLGYRMAMADSILDASESKYLRDLAKPLEIESRYLDVLESSFGGKSYNNQDFQEVCDLVDPARFHDLGTVFVNAADDLLTALNQLVKTEIKEPQNGPRSTASVSGEYQKLQGFQLQKQSLLKRINHLSQLIDGGIKESLLPVTFRDEIQAIKDKLESQRFRVAVIGDFSQGKSTLLNALLGEEIQPVRAIPCSGTLSVLKYGDRKRVICRYRDGSEQEIAVEDYQKKAAISKESALNNRSEELLKSNIAEIVFEHPNLSLCRNGVEIVDSPGLNEHPDRTRVTEALLKETDAILFMTHANRTLTQGERDTINKIKEREGDHPLENLFLVVNFMDNLDSEEDRADVQILANSIIKDGSITGKDRIHFVSAKSALIARVRNISNEYLVSFQNFTRTLETFLTDERGVVILQATVQRLDELTKAFVNCLDNTARSLETKLDKSYREEIIEQIGEATGRFMKLSYSSYVWMYEIIEAVISDWDEFYEYMKQEITEGNTEWETEHNPYWSRDDLVQDYVTTFQYYLEKYIEYWIKEQLSVFVNSGLERLNEDIQSEIKALNSSFSILDKEIGTNLSDEFSGALTNVNNIYASASQSGDISGSVFTAGALIASAVFFSPGLIMLGIGSLLGGGSLALSMSNIYYEIADKVCEEGFNEFEKSKDSLKQKIEDYIDSLFTDRLSDVDQLVKQIISECENRLELEERKQQEEGDRLRSLISSKKQEFEKSLSI